MSIYNNNQIVNTNRNTREALSRNLQDAVSFVKAKDIIRQDPNLSLLEKRKYLKRLREADKSQDNTDIPHDITDILDKALEQSKKNLAENEKDEKIKQKNRVKRKKNNQQGVLSLLAQKATKNMASWLVPGVKMGVGYAALSMLPRFSPVPPSPFEYSQSFGNLQNPFFGGGINFNMMNIAYNPPPAYLTTHSNALMNSPSNVFGMGLQPKLMNFFGTQLNSFGQYNSPFGNQLNHAFGVSFSDFQDAFKTQKNKLIGRSKTSEQKSKEAHKKNSAYLEKYQKAKEKFDNTAIDRKVNHAYQQVERNIPDEHKQQSLLGDTEQENANLPSFRDKDEFIQLVSPKLNPANNHPLADYFKEFTHKRQIKNLNLDQDKLENHFLECVYKRYINNEFDKHLGDPELINNFFLLINEASNDNNFYGLYEENLKEVLQKYNESGQDNSCVEDMANACFEKLNEAFNHDDQYPHSTDQLKLSEDGKIKVDLEKLENSTKTEYEKLSKCKPDNKKMKEICLSRIKLYAELLAISHVNNVANLPYGKTLIDEKTSIN